MYISAVIRLLKAKYDALLTLLICSGVVYINALT